MRCVNSRNLPLPPSCLMLGMSLFIFHINASKRVQLSRKFDMSHIKCFHKVVRLSSLILLCLSSYILIHAYAAKECKKSLHLNFLFSFYLFSERLISFSAFRFSLFFFTLHPSCLRFLLSLKYIFLSSYRASS